MTPLIETDRLIIRFWRREDFAPFAALNADAEVMRYFPAPLSRAGSDALAEKAMKDYEAEGFSYLPVEVKDGARFIGFVGLARVTAPNPLAGDIEIGWRLAREAWGKGYASEAALAWLDFAFEELNPPRVVSFTATANLKSQAVMQRIGLNRRPDLDFDHPALPPGDALQRHVVFASDDGG